MNDNMDTLVDNDVRRKQLTILSLMWILLCKLVKHGNMPVYYHIIGHKDSYNCPIDADTVEIRDGLDGSPKLTIY